MAKQYTPNEKEKYMCEKHKTYFKKRLVKWKNEIVGIKVQIIKWEIKNNVKLLLMLVSLIFII